jgi:4-amino-4-deoxy-L-arabinose transferase-like glycosyltransferase
LECARVLASLLLDADRVNTGDFVSNARSRYARANAVATLITIGFVVWLGIQIPNGILTNTDELLTAERSREMLLTTPWVVRFNFERSFAKPPLQYWLTALTLPRFENRTLAVRIWPLVYGALTAIALAFLARAVAPDQPWVVPLTLAILVCCPLFSAEASRGLLDIGLAFFATLAILFAQLARKNPKWWMGVAVACWLGSLQKIPLIFLLWLVILIVRLSSPVERRSVFNSWLMGSILVGIAATAIWPLFQLARYGMPVRSVFHEEVVVWLGPNYLGARPYLEIPLRLSMTGWIGGGLFAMIAPFAVLFSRKERFTEATKEIAILCLTTIALAVLFHFRSVRYIVPIVPCLCLILANLLHRLLERRSSIRVPIAVLLALILMIGFAQTQIQIYLRQRNGSIQLVNGKPAVRAREQNVADEKRVAEKLGELQRLDTKTVLVKAVKDGSDLLYDSFYLFHGNLRFPVTNSTLEQLRQAPSPPPLVGVCVVRDFPVVQEVYPKVQTQFGLAQFIVWRVDSE